MKKSASIGKRILKIVIAVASAAAIFMAGFAVRYFTLDKSIRSLIWVKDKIDDEYYTEITDEEFLEAAADGVSGLLDKYSTYYTADEYAAAMNSLSGSNVGIGISVSYLSGYARVYRVSGNSPAEKAGLQEGSFIIGYGDDENSITYFEEYSYLTSYLSGKEAGESFVLAAADDPQGTNLKLYTIARESYSENYVFYRSNSSAYRFEGSSATTLTAYDGALEGLDDDTAYIRLNSFAGSAEEQLKMALDVFKSEGRTNLVLDLRSNGGGDMKVLRGIASYLCKRATSSTATVAVARYKDGSSESFNCTGNYYYDYFTDESRITVLANCGTASASECLLGAMLDYGTIGYSDIILSELSGEARTYGKGIMQTTYYNFFGGDAVKLTVAKVHWPVSDKCIHGVGITTDDGARSVPAEDYMTLGDEELKNVVENYLK